MFIRTASERDLPAVSALLGETWHATYDALYGAETVERITSSHHSVDALRRQAERPRSEFIIADDGTAITGVAFAAVAGEDDARIAELVALFVRPSIQGHGVGGMLLQEIERSFFESELLRLSVDERNGRAVGFFESEGFSRTASHVVARLGGATVLTFEKQLA